MSTYVFEPGEVVAVVRGKVVEAILTVDRQKDGVVWLDDGSMWYAASGLPVSGSARRRLTVLTPALEHQLRKRASLLRIAELATMVVEAADQRTRMREPDLERAEGALRNLLRGRAQALPPEERERFWERVEQRLQEAEKGAIDQVRYDLGIG